MFFVFSKIFWILASPLNFIGLLFICAGILKLVKKQKSASFFFASGIGLFLIFGLLPIGHNVLVFLETRYQKPAEMPRNVDGIIVLGGAFNPFMSQFTGDYTLNDNAERMTVFTALARQYPRAKLVFSGGSGDIRNPDRLEADDAKDFMKDMRIPENRVIFERESKNTDQNVRFSKALLKPKEGEKWIVVTSAFHMPRTMGIFEKNDWRVIPYPVDYKTTLQYQIFPSGFFINGNFALLHQAMRESIGILVYYMTGKSAFLLPG